MKPKKPRDQTELEDRAHIVKRDPIGEQFERVHTPDMISKLEQQRTRFWRRKR